LKNSGVELNLIQNSDFFSVYDSVEGVIALAWEVADSISVTEYKHQRLVFHYGQTESQVADKLYERDIVLNWEKNLISHD
jgi:hypothetical protein